MLVYKTLGDDSLCSDHFIIAEYNDVKYTSPILKFVVLIAHIITIFYTTKPDKFLSS